MRLIPAILFWAFVAASPTLLTAAETSADRPDDAAALNNSAASLNSTGRATRSDSISATLQSPTPI